MLKFRTRLSPVALLLVLGACAHSEKSDDPVLKDLEIIGAEQVSEGELKEKILTSETSWLPFSEKKRFDANVWRTDLKRIERYYQARGYYQARVVESEVTPLEDGKVAVRVTVEEGQPTRVVSIALDGGEALERELPLEVGDIFVEETWEGLEPTLERRLRERGHATADVFSQARVDLERQTAALTLEVDAGQRYRFGEVRVKQHLGDRVEEWRIVEQAREAIEDEDYYSDSARAEAQARIFDMDVFGAAKVTMGEPHPETGLVELDVEVQEAPFHTVRAGVGIGIDQARNDAHLIAGYTHRDFLGSLRRLDLEARAGWAFLPTAYAVARGGNRVTQNGPIAEVGAELEQPRLFHPNFSGVTGIELERAIEPAYAFWGARGKLGVSWRPWTYFTLTPSYNYELYQLDQGTVAARSDLGATNLLFGCPGGCVLSYLEQTLAVDRRDDRQEPKRGYFLALSLQEGGSFLGGGFDYLRVVPEVRGYVSMLENERLTFAGKIRAGSLVPLSGGPLDSPIVARFFSGGSQMRGFSTRRLSPQLLVPTPEGSGEFEAEPVPIGGNGLFETQLEARYDLTQSLVGALFTDLGIVTSERLQLSTFDLLQVAFGAGVRYRTPVGPIRLDFAYRPDFGRPLQIYAAEGAAPSFRESEGCFGFGSGDPNAGGAPEGPCSIHLSIGEAF